MLLVCGRWTGPGPAAHGDFCLGRLLGVDGLHRLLLKHWPVTCGFVCRQQTNETGVNNNKLGHTYKQEISRCQSAESVWQFWGSSIKNETAGFRCKKKKPKTYWLDCETAPVRTHTPLLLSSWFQRNPACSFNYSNPWIHTTSLSGMMQTNKLYSKSQHHNNYDTDVLTQVPNHSDTFICCQRIWYCYKLIQILELQMLTWLSIIQTPFILHVSSSVLWSSCTWKIQGEESPWWKCLSWFNLPFTPSTHTYN